MSEVRCGVCRVDLAALGTWHVPGCPRDLTDGACSDDTDRLNKLEWMAAHGFRSDVSGKHRLRQITLYLDGDETIRDLIDRAEVR